MRLELTRKTDLALQVLQTLVRDGGLRKGGALAQDVHTSAGFLAQVMTPLARSGWVESVPGPRGGYRATPTAAAASVLELIEAVEGPISDGRCVLKEQPCPAVEQCALHDVWVPARDAMTAQLAATPVVKSATTSGASAVGARRRAEVGEIAER